MLGASSKARRAQRKSVQQLLFSLCRARQMMFQTGSGRAVNISADSLRRGAALMKSEEKTSEEKTPGASNAAPAPAEPPSSVAGDDCSSKAAEIAKLKEAIKRATSDGEWDRLAPLIQQIKALEQQAAAAAPSRAVPSTRPTFSTGGGRAVQVSATNVQRAQTTLQGTAPADTGAAQPELHPPSRPLFTTGRGRQMSVSADSLQRGRAMMQDAIAAPDDSARPRGPSLHSATAQRRSDSPALHGTKRLLHSASATGASISRSGSAALHATPVKPRPQPRPTRSPQAAAAAKSVSTAVVKHTAANVSTDELQPAQRVQIAQNRAKAESLRRARRALCDEENRKTILAAEAQRNRALLTRRQQELPMVGVWSATPEKPAAAGIRSEPATPCQPRKRQALAIFNSHCPATAIEHGRDELLLAARLA
jgi:hypothetical protein